MNPTMVMSGYHSSTLHLNSDNFENDHVTLSSSKDNKDLERVRVESIPISPHIFSYLMKIGDSCSEMLRPSSSDISIKTQEAHGETL